jgi:hypothetical protein
MCPGAELRVMPKARAGSKPPHPQGYVHFELGENIFPGSLCSALTQHRMGAFFQEGRAWKLGNLPISEENMSLSLSFALERGRTQPRTYLRRAWLKGPETILE